MYIYCQKLIAVTESICKATPGPIVIGGRFITGSSCVHVSQESKT